MLAWEDLNQQFETASPQEILRWAGGHFGAQVALVTSFQPTGVVTLHMLHELKLPFRVMTLDTGLLFSETYTLIQQVEQFFGLRIERVAPPQTVEQQAASFGPALWERQPDVCCHQRKVIPLAAALQPYQAWLTGLRRDQSAGRAQTPIVAWDQRHQMTKIAPLATWTEDMLWTYIQAYDLPYNALYDSGYSSIGCWPCTQKPSDANDKRSGRWVGSAKTECGIHVNPAPA
jgi:phosphoadenosine phosphosulfate reductase